MGAGHLNAQRAVQQYSTGEYDPGNVPALGWDYHTVGGQNEYVFDSGGGWLAATLVWDRRVDKLTTGNYMSGDQFANRTIEQSMNNLDLYLMPANSNDFADAIAVSNSSVESVEHIFFNAGGATGLKLVVHNNDTGGLGTTQNYSLAWWFGEAGAGAPGDFNGDGSVDSADYVVWRKNNGTPQEYEEWRANFGNTYAGSGSIASVPEPCSMLLLGFAVVVLGCRRRGEGALNLI